MTKTEELPRLIVWLDRVIVFWLFVFAIFAPHSIAVTQGAWLLGMAFWVVRLLVFPRPKLSRTPIDYALLGFFILTGLAAFLSYEPMVSIGKLRAASLFTIVYLFFQNIPSLRIARLLAITIIASSLVNVAYTIATRTIGRGIQVHGISANSPLTSGMWPNQGRRIPFPVKDGDSLLEVNAVPIRTAAQVVDALEGDASAPPARLKIYHLEFVAIVEIQRGHTLPGTSDEEKLGIHSWSISRDWRATGFYSHWVTYSQTLVLIASLALGLLIAMPYRFNRYGVFLLIALAGLLAALLLTVTRASWLGFIFSAATIVLVGTSKRTILLLGAALLPLILVGAFLLQQQRRVGFVDQQDQSITWRETVWREGFQLLVSKPRHLLVGVGMDSIKKHWREWGLFDNGRIPLGHMHSNFLEIALERGVPALVLWLILLGAYGVAIWRVAKKMAADKVDNVVDLTGAWVDRGIVLGACGALAGFFTSGFVHYNWGDSTVMMIFYLLMALALFVNRERALDAK